MYNVKKVSNNETVFNGSDQECFDYVTNYHRKNNINCSLSGIAIVNEQKTMVKGLSIQELKDLIINVPYFFAGHEYCSVENAFIVPTEKYDLVKSFSRKLYYKQA